MAEAQAAPAQSYPVTYDVEYPEELSRWLIFIKGILAIPHLVVLYGLGLVASALTFIAFFAILFTKRYPRELFEFVVNINRWTANVTAYIFLMSDDYPPFSWDAGLYPLTYDVEYPEELSRWLIFVKWLLAIPHVVVIMFLFVGALLAAIAAWFAILFTKQYPESLFNFIVGVNRWQYRVNAYTNLMLDEYPPFSLEP
jgi:hypothetical protein